MVEEKTIQEEKRILNVLRILVDKLRTIVQKFEIFEGNESGLGEIN